MASILKEQVFGQRSTQGAGTREKKEFVPANYWMNVGMLVEVQNPENSEETIMEFVSLPVGIPLDTMEKLTGINSTNNTYAARQAARNNLLDQVLEICQTLSPGQEKFLAIDEKTGLAIQIRMVNGANMAADPKNNPFIRKLQLAA